MSRQWLDEPTLENWQVIDLAAEDQLQFWSTVFDVFTMEIRNAVQTTGASVRLVEQYLRSRPFLSRQIQ